MPRTGLIMILASIALAGIFPFAGFFSKDLILEVAFGTHAYALWAVLWITAGLTAFYSFRLVMYIFFGKEQWSHNKGDENYQHPHEAYGFVIAAMAPLAILAVVAGFFKGAFVEMIEKALPELHVHVHGATFWILVAVTLGIALSGIAVAVFKYRKDGTYFSGTFKDRACYKILANQYYMNHLWENFVSKPYGKLAAFSWKEIDLKIIDTIVDAIGKGFYGGGEAGRAMQSGNLSKALKWMGIGIAVLLILVVAFGNLK
jgi:NADH-quinone oxidoreductase subunit L